MRYLNTFSGLLCFCLLFLLQPAAFSADADRAVIEQAVKNPARSAADRKRDRTSKPVEVLSFFGVKPGMKVLDLFSGGAYYSELLYYIVGEKGEVVAHTNRAYAKFAGKETELRFANGRLSGVTRLISEAPAMNLGENRFDMILMVMAYHDIYFVGEDWPAIDRDNFFAQIHAALKPGGILAVVDHTAIPETGSSAAQTLHRIDENFARADIEDAGFAYENSSDVLRNRGDRRSIQVFDGAIQGRTDRFIYRFIKQ